MKELKEREKIKERVKAPPKENSDGKMKEGRKERGEKQKKMGRGKTRKDSPKPTMEHEIEMEKRKERKN